MSSFGKVKDVDHGFRRIRANFFKLTGGKVVRIGIQGSEAAGSREGDITNAALGVIHEFGSKDGTIPQRSWLRGTIDREQRLVQKLLDDAARRAIDSGDIIRRLGIVGLRMVAEIRKTFNQSIGLKANAASTIARKGSTKPLVDVGTLRDSVTSKVE